MKRYCVFMNWKNQHRKLLYYSKQYTDWMESLSKSQCHFCKEIEQKVTIFVWNLQRSERGKAILRKKNKARGITLSDLKLYLQSYDSQTAWQWQKNRPVDQNWEPRNKSTCIWANNFSQTHNGERKGSSINGAGKIEKLPVKEWN